MAEDIPRLTRRQLLIALGAAGVTGGAITRILQAAADEDEAVLSDPAPDAPDVSPEQDPATPQASPTVDPGDDPAAPTDPPEPADTAEPTETPEPEPYGTVPDEVYTEAKLLAAAVAQGMVTYAVGEEVEEVVARSLTRPRRDIDATAVAENAGPLVVPEADSVGRVIYPQLGGLAPAADPQTASVMVVTEQRLRQDGDEQIVTRTIDIRLVIEDGEWHVDALASAGGEQLERPDDLPPEADAVLDDDRIELPDSARWDIYEGIVDRRLLIVMREMADLHPYAVTCLRNGHPINVFGTDRQSNHTAGRGVDIWRVGPEAVVTEQPDQATPPYEVLRDVFDGGVVPELGGPWALDGIGGRSFTNDVHLDHLHIAFYGA